MSVRIEAVGRRVSLAALLVSMRPRQWVKNSLLFMAIAFSRDLADFDLLARTSLAFAVFCGLASATYLLNDLADLERDRLHPVKSKRPIASGRVSPQTALLAAGGMLAVSLVTAAAVGQSVLLIGVVYLLLTASYTLWLKHLLIVDVLAVAAGFVVRAAAGAVVIDVPISPWLYMCTLLGALFISFGKRRHELALLQAIASNHREVLARYSLPFLDQMISIVSAATLIAYGLYTFSAENLPRNHAMMLTIPFVMYGIFRYLYLVQERGGIGSPDEALLADRPLMAAVAGWTVTSMVVMYFVPR